MSFLVATNVVASRPPERWPTGTPHARANWVKVWVLFEAGMLDRVKVGLKLHESSHLCEVSLHAKFQIPSTFPLCWKVCGGWVLKWILVLSFKPKLNNRAKEISREIQLHLPVYAAKKDKQINVRRKFVK